MRIEGRNGFVEFVRTGEEKYPSCPMLMFEVHAACWASYGRWRYEGSDDRVWILTDRLDRFLVELETLETARQGEARLRHVTEVTDPCEFRFRIFSINRAGHMAVETEIQQADYITDGPTWHRVRITFEIDPTLLPQILSEFKVLLAHEGW